MAGSTRVPRFRPRTGMTRLETVRVSQAVGRAARAAAPGGSRRASAIGCGRSASRRSLPPYAPPEILEADLAPLALELARLGQSAIRRALPGSIRRPPPRFAPGARACCASSARSMHAGRITAHGRAMAALPLHPRLAHMALTGQEARPGPARLRHRRAADGARHRPHGAASRATPICGCASICMQRARRRARPAAGPHRSTAARSQRARDAARQIERQLASRE